MAERLRDALFAQNAAVYREIGRLLFEYQVYCGDIAAADSLKLYLSSADLVRIGLKNKAKQKLAFAKVMRLIQEIQKQPEITEELKVDDAPKSVGSEPEMGALRTIMELTASTSLSNRAMAGRGSTG